MTTRVLSLVIVFQFFGAILAADYIPTRNCATLYSQDNFEGEEFVLHDFDQSVSTQKDFRNSIDGWKKTGSIRVENGCSMHFCDDTYFTGNCSILTGQTQETSLVSEIRSANCTCDRQCSCESVHLPNDIYRPGRAYLKGGCRKCDTEYIPLFTLQGNFYYSNLVEAIKIRSGCNIILYSELNLQGESRLIEQGIVEDFNGSFRSYEITCNKSEHLLHNSSKNEEVLGRIPDSHDELLQLVESDEYDNETHPGYLAAKRSYDALRSWKNAYIIFIGNMPPSYILPASGCNTVLNGPIKECRIPVNMSDLKISNAEVRIIFYDDRLMNSEEDDYQIIASMHDYIANHEELRNVIPNAAILSQRITSNEDFTKEDSQMQRKLKILDVLRQDILDSKYNNVIFLLRNEDSYYPVDRRNPEETVNQFEKSVYENWEFPEPIAITTHQYPRGFHALVSGFRKMENGEYWPMSIRDNLLRICEKSGDDLGHAIFKAAFQNDKISSNVTLISKEWLPKNHTLIDFYRTCLTAFPRPVECPSISWLPKQNEPSKLMDPISNCNCTMPQPKYLELEQRISLLEELFKNSTLAHSDFEVNANTTTADDKQKELEHRVACLGKIL